MTLTPLGAARLRFGQAAPGPRWPSELRDRLREHDLGDEALYLAWELARLAPALSADEQQALELLVLASLIAVRQGSTRLPVSGDDGVAWLDELFRSLGAPDGALELARRMLAELRQARLAGRPARLDPVVGLPGEYKPLILDQYQLYHQRMLHAEDRLAAALSARLSRTEPEAHVREAVAAVAGPLSDEQRRAVEAALASPLTVVSGGPGTGKTSIVATVLRAAARLGLGAEAIALAAPTGKAAWRLREAIAKNLQRAGDALACPEAQTLHRLLGWSPSLDRFRHHAHNRLAHRLVIVDEASMIDLHLMDHLVRAVRDDAHLVLLGDADQLPSVEAGAVFRDLAPIDRAAVRLTRSYRMSPERPAGRRILEVAGAINTGALPDDLPERAAAEVAFFGVELTRERDAFLDRWLGERVLGLPGYDDLARRVYRRQGGAFDDEARAALRTLFDHFDRLRLLCLRRGDSEGGAAWVNARMHRAILDRARATGDDAFLRGTPAFWPGEPILVLRNDYERGLFNGDQGLVLRVADGHAPACFMAVFPREDDIAVFHLEPLKPVLTHAFAMTVHKSQGSELDHAAIVLPNDDLPLATRELFYTAVTRARESVVFVGAPDVLRRGVARRIKRFSGLAAKLSRGAA